MVAAFTGSIARRTNGRAGCIPPLPIPLPAPPTGTMHRAPSRRKFRINGTPYWLRNVTNLLQGFTSILVDVILCVCTGDRPFCLDSSRHSVAS